MKKFFILFTLFFLSLNGAFSATGWYQDYVQIDVNGVGVTAPTGWFWIGTDPNYGTILDTRDFGVVNSFVLRGCDMKYWSDSKDRNGGAFYYKIMDASNTTLVVTGAEQIWTQNYLGGKDYQGIISTEINLLTGLQPNTTYKLHLWAKSWGSGEGDSWLSNNSNDYVATFTTGPNIWKGATNENWSEPTNWSFGVVPTPTTDVIFPASTTIDLIVDADAHARNITLESTTNRLFINAGQSLTVSGTLTNTSVNQILIKSGSSAANGTLIFSNPLSNANVKATVEFYSKAFKNDDAPTNNKYKWQYFGIPVKSVSPDPTFYLSSIKKWNEPTGWVIQNNSSILVPFYGYEITQDVASTYAIQGELNTNNFSTGELSVTTGAAFPGQHILANPYTAAVDITKIEFGTGMDKTIYLFNTGSHADWENATLQTSDVTTPGAYISVPYNTAGQSGLPAEIPSMQGFLVIYDGTATAGKTVSFDYSSVTVKNTKPLRATAQPLPSIVITAQSETYSDRVWIFSEPTTTSTYDNGWDGVKISTGTDFPQIFVKGTDYHYQVFTTNNVDETFIDFKASSATQNYSLTIESSMNTQYPNLALVDLLTNTRLELTNPTTTYNFTASNITAQQRFKITTVSSVPTAIENCKDLEQKTSVYVKDNLLYINNMGSDNVGFRLIDLTGKVLMTKQLMQSTNVIPVTFEHGIYLVEITADNNKMIRKVKI